MNWAPLCSVLSLFLLLKHHERRRGAPAAALGPGLPSAALLAAPVAPAAPLVGPAAATLGVADAAGGKVARWQNLIPSFPRIAPGWRAWGRNIRKGRDQILQHR